MFRNQQIEARKMSYLQEAFKAITVYSPNFRTYNGGIYEMDLTRAAIHTIANHGSKAKPIIRGDKYKSFEKILQSKPNGLMTGQPFLYKTITILVAENTCFLIPLYEDRSAGKIIGIQPVSSLNSKITHRNGKDWLQYQLFEGGQIMDKIIPLSEVGILRDHYYSSDFYGESNNALAPTLEVLDVQNQGIIEGVKQSARIRFMMKLSQVAATPEKFKEARNRLVDLNLTASNNNGIFLYDKQYEEAKQIDSKPFIVDAEQSNGVKNNVYNYFGVNEKLIQNNFTDEEFNAFYEGRLEPILIQISEVITSMLFTDKDIQAGSMVIYESSRLQTASNTVKKDIVTALMDRGLLTLNQGLDVFNLPPVEDGDKRYIRREYVEISKLSEGSNNDNSGQTV